MVVSLPDRYEGRTALCPQCKKKLFLVIKQDTYKLWWCTDCVEPWSERHEIEDVIDPYGRI